MARQKREPKFTELRKTVAELGKRASYEELDELRDELKSLLGGVEAKMQIKKEREYMRLKKQIDALGLTDEQKQNAEKLEDIRNRQELNNN